MILTVFGIQNLCHPGKGATRTKKVFQNVKKIHGRNILLIDIKLIFVVSAALSNVPRISQRINLLRGEEDSDVKTK